MFQRLFLTVLMLLSAVLVSACSSVTPARFQRGFTVGGTIHETVIDEDGEASHFMVTGTRTSTTYDDTSSANRSFQIGSQASATWYTAVPEPTSGLLMLLGMAGLALRRKQK